MTPYHCVYDAMLDCYFITEVGTITYRDALQLLDMLRNDKNYHHAKRILSDVRLARMELTEEERVDIRQRLVPAPHARCAVVVNQGAQYGAYKIVKDMMPEITMEIFTDMATAREWLGLSED